MMVDLVILNSHPPSYLQELGDRITAAVLRRRSDPAVARPAGRRVRPAARPARRRRAARCCARPRACTSPATGARWAGSSATGACRTRSRDDELDAGRRRSARARRGATRGWSRAVRRIGARLADAAGVRSRHAPRLRAADAAAPARPTAPPAASTTASAGSTPDGDYEIRVRGDRVPPAPWSNVIANPHGGFVVTERGGGFTWAENSYFFRLTPWHNDPVERSGERGALPARRGDRRALVRDARRRSGTPPPTPCATAPGAPRSRTSSGGIATHLTLGMADGRRR